MGRSIDNVSRSGYLQHDNWFDLGSGHTSLKRGRGRPRGPSRTSGKSQRKTDGYRDDQCHVTVGRGGKFGELTGWRGRPSRQSRCKKGRRAVRNRQKPAKRVAENAGENRVSLDNVSETPYIHKEEWDLIETPIEAAGGENRSSSERSNFGDLNVQASADEYKDILVGLPDVGSVDYGDVENVQHVDIGNRDNMDDDNDDEGDDVEDFEPLDYYVDGDFNQQYNDEENQSTGEEQVGNVDRSSDRGSSSSSDYSF